MVVVMVLYVVIGSVFDKHVVLKIMLLLLDIASSPAHINGWYNGSTSCATSKLSLYTWVIHVYIHQVCSQNAVHTAHIKINVSHMLREESYSLFLSISLSFSLSLSLSLSVYIGLYFQQCCSEELGEKDKEYGRDVRLS